MIPFWAKRTDPIKIKENTITSLFINFIYTNYKYMAINMPLLTKKQDFCFLQASPKLYFFFSHSRALTNASIQGVTSCLRNS